MPEADPRLVALFEAVDRAVASQGLPHDKVIPVLAQYLGKVILNSLPVEAQVPRLDVAWRAVWSIWAGTTAKRYGIDRTIALVELFRASENRDPGSLTSVS